MTERANYNMGEQLSEYLIEEPTNPSAADYPRLETECPVQFNFELDRFQIQAANAILKNENVLISAHTGSGKTVPCLIAIKHFLGKGQRVLYTSPVKSLSNQKFKEFQEKAEIPDVGIMTGDIKCNPDAQCVIMTTEILRNMLYKDREMLVKTEKHAAAEVAGGDVDEKVDEKIDEKVDEKKETVGISALDTGSFLSDVGAVIFDEVHYINDRDRGKNWEESLVMLPPRITLLMLSATIDRPENFGSWIGDLKKRPVHLIKTLHRPIPLNHYMYVDNLPGYGLYKKKKRAQIEAEKQKDTEFQKDPFIRSGLIHVMRASKFLAPQYDEAYALYRDKWRDPITKKPVKGKGNPRWSQTQSPGDLNKFLKFLQGGGYLPALIFVLSRKRVEDYAAAVQISLVKSEQRAEIKRIFNHHMHGLREQYEGLDQYAQIRDLLFKGIGIHHSGLIPVLKEIVEILFSMGLIQILFATETFAIGVNMPTKTVVFTELTKWDGYRQTSRYLKTDEYLQMSGRAGRRGLDPTGTIIHFPLKELPNSTEMRGIVTGRTPTINSQFTAGYQFLMKCLANGKDVNQFLGQSLRAREDRIMARQQVIQAEQTRQLFAQSRESFDSKYGSDTWRLAEEFEALWLRTQPQQVGDLLVQRKKDKKLEKKVAEVRKKLPKGCYAEYQTIKELDDGLTGQDIAMTQSRSGAGSEAIEIIFDYLTNLGYLCRASSETAKEVAESPSLTVKGIIASEINDCNCLILTEMITQDFFEGLTGSEIIALLALFIEEHNLENGQMSLVSIKDKISSTLFQRLQRANILRDDLRDREDYQVVREGVQPNTDWDLHLDFVLPALVWAEGGNLPEIYEVCNIYEGNFIKSMLRLQNLAEGMVMILQTVEKHSLANLLQEAANSIIRDIVTANSLYISQ